MENLLSNVHYHRISLASTFIQSIIEKASHHLLVTNLQGDVYGSVQTNEHVYVLEQSGDEHFIYEMTPETKEMRIFFFGKSDQLYELDPVKLYEQVSETADGLTWKGNLVQGKPFGYGYLEDQQGVSFEGFMVDGKKLYGRVWESGKCCSSCWCDDRITGFETVCTMDGKVEWEGYCIRGEKTDDDSPHPSFCHSQQQHYYVPDNSCNEVHSLHFNGFVVNLETMIIGKNSFQNAHSLVLSCPRLKSIQIGEQCFCSEAPFQVIKISDCPHLETIDIQQDSFVFYEQFILFDLPKLKNLTLGSRFCKHAHSFYCRSRTRVDCSVRSPFFRIHLSKGQGIPGYSQPPIGEYRCDIS